MFYWYWNENAIYPEFLKAVLDPSSQYGIMGGFTDPTYMDNLKMALVTDIMNYPRSQEETWTNVKANIIADGGGTGDYMDGYGQAGTGGDEFGSTISYATNTQIGSNDENDAAYWGIANLQSDVSSVFSSVPTLGSIDPAFGTKIKYIILYSGSEDDLVIGIIQRDSGDEEISIVPDGSDITINWYDPSAGAAGQPGMLFAFDICDQTKEQQ